MIDEDTRRFIEGCLIAGAVCALLWVLVGWLLS